MKKKKVNSQEDFAKTVIRMADMLGDEQAEAQFGMPTGTLKKLRDGVEKHGKLPEGFLADVFTGSDPDWE